MSVVSPLAATGWTVLECVERIILLTMILSNSTLAQRPLGFRAHTLVSLFSFAHSIRLEQDDDAGGPSALAQATLKRKVSVKFTRSLLCAVLAARPRPRFARDDHLYLVVPSHAASAGMRFG